MLKRHVIVKLLKLHHGGAQHPRNRQCVGTCGVSPLKPLLNSRSLVHLPIHRDGRVWHNVQSQRALERLRHRHRFDRHKHMLVTRPMPLPLGAIAYRQCVGLPSGGGTNESKVLLSWNLLLMPLCKAQTCSAKSWTTTISQTTGSLRSSLIEIPVERNAVKCDLNSSSASSGSFRKPLSTMRMAGFRAPAARYR